MAGEKLHIFLIQGEFFAGTVTETKILPSHNESGKPDSCAGARLLQQPNFLSAECAYPIKRGTLSCPGAFYVIGRCSYYIKSFNRGTRLKRLLVRLINDVWL